MGAKKTVMLTGASGHMGFHGFKELTLRKTSLILFFYFAEVKKTVLNSRILKMILQSE